MREWRREGDRGREERMKEKRKRSGEGGERADEEKRDVRE